MLSNKALSASKQAALGITYVGGYVQAIAGTTTSVNVSLTSLTGGVGSQPANDDLIIVTFGVAGATTSASLSITGYEQLYQLDAADTVDTRILVAYKYATSDTSLTIPAGTGDANDTGVIAIQVFRNAFVNGEWAGAVGNNSVLANPPQVFPINTGSWVVACGVGGHTAGLQTYSGASYTNFISTGSNQTYDATVGMGYLIWSGTGAVDPSAFTFSGTNSGSYSWGAASITISPNSTSSQTRFANTIGSFAWIVPPNVTSISMVCIGGGQGGSGSSANGGNGGSLRYANNVSVTPKSVLTVTVGQGGPAGTVGDNSSVILAGTGTTYCLARGGGRNPVQVGTGFNGGSGGAGSNTGFDPGAGVMYNGGGAGGAGGYSGVGGAGRSASGGAGSTGTGGSGGGGGITSALPATDGLGNYDSYPGGSGGGVGLNGEGASGAGGSDSTSQTARNGKPGSSGVTKTFGGGGGGGYDYYDSATGVLSNFDGFDGGQGGVRLIWPGTARQYPSTRTANE